MSFRGYFVGTSGYHYRHWRERFYPRSLPAREWLAYYAREFDTLELNVTYYRVPVLLVLALGPVAGLAFILFLPMAVPIVALYWGVKIIRNNVPWLRRKRAGEELRPAR